MGKLIADAVLDAALSYISANTTQMSVCSDTPTTYSNATTAGSFRLALKTGLTGADFTGPSAGSQRQLSVNQQAAIAVSNSGSATHICLCSGSVLLYVTTCTAQALTSGNTVTVPAWTISIASPV